ncbi:MAG: hypothetical protein AB7G93_04740 [Bdellovibrionales bacterium]
MKKDSPFIGLLLTILLFLLWLGFLVHRDESFAGSFTGGVLAVSGSLLLLVPFVYLVIKRILWLKALVTKHVSFSTLLTIHIYAGFIGAILVILHTGHKFHGGLAVSLSAMLLIVVFSGYVGRYLLMQISKELSEKRRTLEGLEFRFSKNVMEIQNGPYDQKQLVGMFSGAFARVFAPLFLRRQNAMGATVLTVDTLELAESISDVEYAVATHNLFKKAFSYWLKIHIALSFVFYFLLLLHVVGEYHFGLRWFR